MGAQRIPDILETVSGEVKRFLAPFLPRKLSQFKNLESSTQSERSVARLSHRLGHPFSKKVLDRDDFFSHKTRPEFKALRWGHSCSPVEAAKCVNEFSNGGRDGPAVLMRTAAKLVRRPSRRRSFRGRGKNE